MARKALLIGTKTYGDGFKTLNSALHDVQALAAVLGNPDVGGFAVEVAEDLAAAELAQRMETWYLSHAKDDLALLFVAGHGVKDGDRKLHFAATNTQKQGEQLVTSTAIAASNLSQWLRASKAKRQVVILNCCFSGAFGDLVPMDDGVIGVEDALGAEGRVVLTSTSSMDYAFERLNGELSVYGHYLVEGLQTGAAAALGSDDITIAELHEYVSRKLQEEGSVMVPQWFARGEAARLRIARVAIGDPAVRYRKKVEEILRDDGNEIDEVFSRPILVELCAKLSLKQTVAEAIEAEVLEPIQQRQAKRQEYRKFFEQAVQRCHPFGAREQKRVDEYRRMLGLQDEDYAEIEAAVLENVVGVNAVTQDTPQPKQPEQSTPIKKTALQIKSQKEQPIPVKKRMPQKTNSFSLCCSFCGKPQERVQKLIAGPGVYICDECVDSSNETIDEILLQSQDKSPPDESKPSILVKNTDQRCSFCGNHRDLVRELLAGPGVCICNNCLELCNDILDDECIPSKSDRQATEP